MRLRTLLIVMASSVPLVTAGCKGSTPGCDQLSAAREVLSLAKSGAPELAARAAAVADAFPAQEAAGAVKTNLKDLAEVGSLLTSATDDEAKERALTRLAAEAGYLEQSLGALAETCK